MVDRYACRSQSPSPKSTVARQLPCAFVYTALALFALFGPRPHLPEHDGSPHREGGKERPADHHGAFHRRHDPDPGLTCNFGPPRKATDFSPPASHLFFSCCRQNPFHRPRRINPLSSSHRLSRDTASYCLRPWSRPWALTHPLQPTRARERVCLHSSTSITLLHPLPFIFPLSAWEK